MRGPSSFGKWQITGKAFTVKSLSVVLECSTISGKAKCFENLYRVSGRVEDLYVHVNKIVQETRFYIMLYYIVLTC